MTKATLFICEGCENKVKTIETKLGHNHCKVQVGINESAVLQHKQQQTQSLLGGLRNEAL
jgi:hypothetical protein